MCGLFGFAGLINPSQRALLAKSLCVFNADRGEDSVGLAAIDTELKRHKVWRDVATPHVAVVDPKFLAIAKRRDANVWIGHTRWKTMGAITVNNAHPFVIGNTIGAHNGCVLNTEDFAKRIGRKYEVDSQYLIHAIDADDKVGDMSGTACISYVRYDNPDDLTLMRWSNPLSVAMVNNQTGIVWSSELKHLKGGMAIAGIRDYDMVQIADGDRLDFNLPQSTDGVVTYSVSDAPIHDIGYSSWFKRKSVSHTAWDMDGDNHDSYYQSDFDKLPVKYQNVTIDDEVVDVDPANYDPELDDCIGCGQLTRDEWYDERDDMSYAMCHQCAHMWFDSIGVK